MHRRLFAVAAALPFVSIAGLAQTPHHLVGFTRTVPTVRHLDPGGCTLVDQCTPLAFPSGAGLSRGAGGAAWDPTAPGLWITNGSTLARVDDHCDYGCAPLPLGLPAGTEASGLEVVESLRELWMIDDHAVLRRYDLVCPPALQSQCQTALLAATPTLTPTGIAVDEGLGLVFYAITDFATNDNWIAVATVANPCGPVQRVPIQPCQNTLTPFRSFEGLAVDWCHRVIFATDGRTTMAIRYTPLAVPGIAVTGISCCTALTPNLDPMVGLAVRPGRETPFGTSCANGTCPTCPMRHSLGNDPNVGNSQFFTRTSGAPGNALAWDILSVGPCNPGPTAFPLCGPILATPIVLILGPVLTNGPANSCAGDAEQLVGLPLDPSFCGIVISSQSLVLCFGPNGAIGTSLSNCISFELQGS